MKYAQIWSRPIGPDAARLLILFCAGIFVLHLFFISAQLRAKRFNAQAQAYLKEAGKLAGQGIIVEQAISYQRAIRLLARAIESDPLDAKAYFTYAESLNDAMSQGPQLIEMLDLGRDQGHAGEKNAIIINSIRRNYASAVKRNPTNAIYHQRLASIYEKLSDYIQAEAELKKAALLDLQNVSIHLYLAQYYLSRNKIDEFNYHLDKVVRLYKLALTGGGPMEQLASMVIEYLKSINREELIRD